MDNVVVVKSPWTTHASPTCRPPHATHPSSLHPLTMLQELRLVFEGADYGTEGEARGTHVLRTTYYVLLPTTHHLLPTTYYPLPSTYYCS